MKYKMLIQDIKNAKPIQVSLKNKKYIFHTFSFGERGAFINPGLLKEIKKGLLEKAKEFPAFDYIVSPEPGGHFWGILIADKIGLPLNVIREKPNNANKEIIIKQMTGYYHRDMHFNNFKKGDRVLIIDDVISTGGTARAIIKTLKKLGVKIVGIVSIVTKRDNYKKITEEEGVPVKFLVNINKEEKITYQKKNQQ